MRLTCCGSGAAVIRKARECPQSCRSRRSHIDLETQVGLRGELASLDAPAFGRGIDEEDPGFGARHADDLEIVGDGLELGTLGIPGACSNADDLDARVAL